MKRSFLIDTDTASDDAVALIMALKSRSINVLGITIVAGNVDAKQAARNAGYTAELCGVDVPIFVGEPKPLSRPSVRAHWFHGRDGMGDMNYPAPKRKADKEHAVAAIRHIIRDNPGIVLVTLGPLTNIAKALRADPALAKNVSRCVVMGGNPLCVGNITPAAEYNIYCDPEAARIVFRSGMKIDLVGWQLSRNEYALNAKEIARVRKIGTALSDFSIDCNRVARGAFKTQTGQDGITLPDAVAMAVALDPKIITASSEHRVEVARDGELARGMTIVDELNISTTGAQKTIWQKAKAPMRVVWKLDAGKWKEMLYQSLGLPDPPSRNC